MPTTFTPYARTCIIVAGMHRSGTSVVAGCVNAAGVAVGAPLLPPADDNPKGFFEHLDVVNLHDAFLGELGLLWSDPIVEVQAPSPQVRAAWVAKIRELYVRIASAERGVFMFKDPRSTRFLDLWAEALAELGVKPAFLVCVRNPQGVVNSLVRRDRLSPAHAEALWAFENALITKHVEAHTHTIVDYSAFLQAPAHTLTQAFANLDLTGFQTDEGTLSAVVERTLDHSKGAAFPLHQTTLNLADRLRDHAAHAKRVDADLRAAADAAQNRFLRWFNQHVGGAARFTLRPITASLAAEPASPAAQDHTFAAHSGFQLLRFALPSPAWTRLQFRPADIACVVILRNVCVRGLAADGALIWESRIHPAAITLTTKGKLFAVAEEAFVDAREAPCMTIGPLAAVPPAAHTVWFEASVGVRPPAFVVAEPFAHTGAWQELDHRWGLLEHEFARARLRASILEAMLAQAGHVVPPETP